MWDCHACVCETHLPPVADLAKTPSRAPFQSPLGEVSPFDSELPILRFIFVNHVRNFPFLDKAREKEFWQRATIDSSSIQCSCFPVRTWFSMASCEKGVWSSEDMFGSRRKAASAAGQVGGELGAGCNRSRRIFAEDESGGGDSCRSGGAGCEK